jgi:hypothetical protein
MNVLLILISLGILCSLISHSASAEVFVPKNEILTYFDSKNIYTVVGAVKNTEDFPVIPTVHLNFNENGEKTVYSQTLPIAFSDKDIPFKIKIPTILDSNVILENVTVDFESQPGAKESGITVVYDRTMTQHADGHLSAKITNTGSQTEHNVKIYATVHGSNNSFVDVAQNLEKIDKIEPGQIVEFTMYPDPIIANKVRFFSCFALGDPTVVPLSAIKNGKKFDFRYDSPAASFRVKGFDDSGNSLMLVGINSFKVPTFVSFEFPPLSGNEKFSVLIDEKPVKFIQSKDENGNWHVAFNIAESATNQITITGFEKTSTGRMPILTRTSGEVNQNLSDYLPIYAVIVAVAAVGLFAIYRKKTKQQKQN